MSNMSHCRFQNTLEDLKDCNNALIELFAGEHGALSDDELDAAKWLAVECARTLKIITENAENAEEIIAEFIECDMDKPIDALIDAAQEECYNRRDENDDE